jgi:hypothetical protein
MYLLALALGRPIHAEATCPTTGTPIRVDLTPEGVDRIDPSTPVVAVVDLDADLTLGPDRIDAEVCARQPLFASAQVASRGWMTTRRVGSFRCGPSTPRPAGSSIGWRPHRRQPQCRERGGG